MNKSLKKFLIFVAVVAAFVLLCVLLSMRSVDNYSDKYAGCDLSQDVEGMERTGTYTDYLNEYPDASYPDGEYTVDLFTYESEGDVEVYYDYEGVSVSLYTAIGSSVTWTVDVAQAGFYNIELEYLIPESKGVEAERSVLVNGVSPFSDADNITFTRIWTDGGEVRTDNQGNEIRPTQTEIYDWQTSRLRDDRGYTAEPYVFYFEQGTNTITFEGENEPMVYSSLKVCSVSYTPTYEEYLASTLSLSNSSVSGFEEYIQGEDSTARSESSLYAKYDRSSPTTQPYCITHTVLNYTGGDVWRTNGQWIEWDFEVPADGYYNITIKGRQNYSRGSVSSRSVSIDGSIPFKELEQVEFTYDTDWQLVTLGDEDGNAYSIYLTAGSHTIRLTATLGDLGEILSELEDSTYRLNQIYRKILVYTGANPDTYRDYHIDSTYPEIMEAMALESKRLYKLVDDTVAVTGQKADNIATAQTVAQQLERFCEKPQKITTEFTTFKDNITALGTASLNMNYIQLDVDYLVVDSTDQTPAKDSSNFFKKCWHEIKSFFVSFFIDYNSVGDVYADDDDVVTIWILTGRDQGTIMKAMVDDTFTPNTGIPVNVEVVGADAVLNAVMAGQGPNVILSVGADQPVNYALRGAAEDLTQFDDWEEVFANYSPSSYEQYSLDGAIYAVPETQTFNVMFYRKDILEELGLEVPETWQDLIEMLPTIQGNNLSVGLPSAAGSNSSSAASTASAANNGDLSMYFSLMFQYGGDIYNEAGTKTIVNEEAGIKAFEEYVRYFNDYGLPTIYDFVSRFRSGEMPIGIAAYSVYNTLVVSAPEIRGLWDFTLIPGIEKTDEDGNTYVDHTDMITGSCTMMISCDDEDLKQKAWKFMKWWAQPDTQTRFGREIEALLGSSARYATANREAFSSLSWSPEDIEVLNAQWDQTKGIREVPGGYFTGRHITNAIRKVLNEKVDSRETIIDYAILIDEEIAKKRKEFGMSLE